LDLADHLGHEFGRPRADVDVDVSRALLVLKAGQLQQALDVFRVEELLGRGDRIVDRFTDDR